MTLAIDIKFFDRVWQHWQIAKNLTNSAQALGQSLQAKATQTTDKTIDAVTQTFDQSWQTAEQFKAMTVTAIQTSLLNPTEGISAAVNDWLLQHPTLWRLVQTLDWAANHPIISLVILLFALTLVWSMIKAIMSLIERASWSILQVPLKLIQALIKFIFFSLIKVFSSALQKTKNHQPNAVNLAASPTENQIIYQEKQQRLAEISLRLQAIQQEQKELLQEAATLIAAENIDIKIPEIIRNG